MYECKVNHTDFVFRLYPQNKDKASFYEKDLINKLKNLNCLVPEIIAGESGSINGSYLIYKKAQGLALAQVQNNLTKTETSKLSNAILDYFEKLKQISIKGFGGLVSLNEAEQKNAKAFWGNAVLNCINKVKETKVLSLQILNSLDNIHKKHIDNLNINNALAWGDLSPSNLIVNDKKKLVSIIDFESYFIFDSALSLGYFSAIAPQNSLCKELMTQSKNYPSLNLTQENIDLCAILRLCRLAPHD